MKMKYDYARKLFNFLHGMFMESHPNAKFGIFPDIRPYFGHMGFEDKENPDGSHSPVVEVWAGWLGLDEMVGAVINNSSFGRVCHKKGVQKYEGRCYEG